MRGIRVNKQTGISKLWFRATILAMGIALGLSLLIGAARATDETDSSLYFNSGSYYDTIPPVVINVNTLDTPYEGAAVVESDFVDLESGIEPTFDQLTVPNAMITGCEATDRKIKCGAVGIKRGEQVARVSVKDKYGNRTEKDHSFFMKEKTAPATSDNAPAGWQKADVNVALACADGAEGSGCNSTSWSTDDGKSGTGGAVVIDKDGETTITYHSTDRDGNTESKKTKKVKKDNKPPETTDNAPAGWQNTDVTVALTCTDTGSGCAATTYEVNGGATQTGNTVSLTVEGAHTITYRSTDVAGNVENTKTATVKIDKTAPVIDSITVGPDNEVTVLFHDPYPSSGIASVKVTVDGQELECFICERHRNGMGPYVGDGHSEHGEGLGTGHYVDENHDVIDNNVFAYPVPAGTETEPNDFTCSLPGDLACGPHDIVATVTDYAGNSTTEDTVYNKGDCEPPVTTDDAPAGWQNTDVTVTLACTDNVSGCATTTYEVNGGATQTGNTVLLTDEGVHTITYRSTDVAGNVEADNTATVMIDKTPPAVTTSGDVTVEATGPSGAVATFTSSATDIVDGAVATTCVPPSGSTFPLGSTLVTCSATDAAGNTGTATLTVTVVDTTAPVVTYISPVDTIYDTTSPPTTGTATDDVGVTSAWVVIDGTTTVSCTVDGLGNVSCPTPSLTYGWHTSVIYATDAAGNTGSATGTFCVSSGRPNLMLYKIKGPYVVSGDPYRWVRVDYRMTNTGGPDAFNVRMMSMTANNGIYLTDPLPLPLALGNITSGASFNFTVKYYWPVGVTTYKFTNTACAEDQCFTEYFYP